MLTSELFQVNLAPFGASLNRLSGLDIRYEEGAVEEQRDIISSMFPENLVFDGVQHRTPGSIRLCFFIYNKHKELQVKKMGQTTSFRACPIR